DGVDPLIDRVLVNAHEAGACLDRIAFPHLFDEERAKFGAILGWSSPFSALSLGHSSLTALRPVKSSHRFKMTSQYAGSISIPKHRRSVFSQAMSVDPEPVNGS